MTASLGWMRFPARSPVRGLWAVHGLDYADTVVASRIVWSLGHLPELTDAQALLLTFGLQRTGPCSAPPPWQWHADVLLSALGSHSAYIVTVWRIDAVLR